MKDGAPQGGGHVPAAAETAGPWHRVEKCSDGGKLPVDCDAIWHVRSQLRPDDLQPLRQTWFNFCGLEDPFPFFGLLLDGPRH